MKLIYHNLAVRDVREILDHYELEGGKHLGDRFFGELLATLGKALANPEYFPPAGDSARRANLEIFPYHILYEVKAWGIKVMVVRHHHRNPHFGTRRR
jgi:plasmid stabilization system protein ParE